MFVVLALLASSTILAVIGAAQSQVYGALGGAITDPQGGAVVGATVNARSLATDAVSTAKSDGTGRYLITNLQPGNYELTTAVTGFAPIKQTVVVEVGIVTNADINLGLAGQTQSVTVSGEAPTVNTEQSTFGENFNTAALENLPINARRWSYFALNTPGAVPDGTFGDIAFRGVGYVFDNNTVDGTANTQAFFAEEVGRTRMAYSTSLNSVQEFQVTTSAYSAEFGRAVGGVVNAITKSGSNEIHGDLFYFNRDNTIGGAFTPFATGAVLQPSGLYSTVPIKPLDIRQQMGGDAGGRIIKDKLFWYFNFDDQIHHFPATNIPTSPGNFFAPITVEAPLASVGTCASLKATLSGSGASKNLSPGNVLYCRGFTQDQVNSALTFLDSTTGTSPRTGDQTLFFPKIDWKPTDHDTVTLSYNRARWTSPYGVQTGSVVARSIDSNGNDYVHDDRAIASWNTTIGSALTNSVRLSYSRDYEFEFTTPSLSTEPVSPLTGLSPQVDINSCGFTGITATQTTTESQPCGWTLGAPYYLERPAYPNEQRYQVTETFGATKGRHLIKAGIDVTHVSDDLNSYASGDQLGEYSYTYLQDFISDYITQANSLPGACQTTSAGTTYQIPCYNDYFQTFGPLAFNVSTLETAFFVQDDWHATRRLTINAGLRYDHEEFPATAVPNPAIPQTIAFPSEHKEWQPRFGFAWDVFGNGRTALRGGYGMYYGRITNEQIYEELTLTGSLEGQISPTIFPTTGSSNSTGVPTPGEPIYPNILPPAQFGVGKPNIVYFPNDLRLPGAEEFDLVLEHQIARNTLVSVSYIGSIGRFLPIGIDTNLPAATSINYTVSGGPLNGQTVTEPFFSGAHPNPNYTHIVMYCSCVTSHYNGLVGQFNRRLTDGLQFNLSYTYASATDDGASSSAALTSNGPVNPGDLALEEGRSYLEVRNRFVGSIVWEPPYFAHSDNMLARGALSGWTISLNQIAQSGLPYGATISGNEPSGLGATISSGGPTGGATSTRALFVPKNGFTLPATYNTDMRIGRSFHIYEKARLEFTVEAFNLLNHVNYTSASTSAYTIGGTAAAPTLTYNATGFGTLLTANNSVFLGARQIQFGAKFSF